MMLEVIRRRIALWVAPELADLPFSQNPAGFPPAQSPEKARMAQELRRLDRLYTAFTGVLLTTANAPAYDGPVYQWRRHRSLIMYDVVATLKRLRVNTVGGVRSTTSFVARCYFSSIWPADLEWPHDISRPPKSKEAA